MTMSEQVLSYDPTQEPRQSDVARETGTLSCLTTTQEPTQTDVATETGTLTCFATKFRSRGVAVRCCQRDGDIELFYDPT